MSSSGSLRVLTCSHEGQGETVGKLKMQDASKAMVSEWNQPNMRHRSVA